MTLISSATSSCPALVSLFIRDLYSNCFHRPRALASTIPPPEPGYTAMGFALCLPDGRTKPINVQMRGRPPFPAGSHARFARSVIAFALFFFFLFYPFAPLAGLQRVSPRSGVPFAAFACPFEFPSSLSPFHSFRCSYRGDSPPLVYPSRSALRDEHRARRICFKLKSISTRGFAPLTTTYGWLGGFIETTWFSRTISRSCGSNSVGFASCCRHFIIPSFRPSLSG